MNPRILGKLAGVVGSALALGACGGRARSLYEGSAGAPSGGAYDAAGGSLVTTGGGATSAGAEAENSSGAAGQPDAPTPDISGRWALFNFEDPVGVQLFQDGNSLSGRGCDVGSPPLNPDLGPQQCGDIAGKVNGNHAYFDFHTNGYDYIADVTVSADGARMAGRFHGVSTWLPFSTAWLRVADGSAFLPGTPQSGLPLPVTQYHLLLSNADAGGEEYLPSRPYLITYTHGLLSGDLGSFWLTEIMSRAADGRIVVGPVPETEPNLPVSVSMDAPADGLITQVTAVTGSGHEYTFSATPLLAL